MLTFSSMIKFQTLSTLLMDIKQNFLQSVIAIIFILSKAATN